MELIKTKRSETSIHPTAIVEEGAVIGEGVEIGPYAVIGPNVQIGDGCKIGPHVVIAGSTMIGKNCRFSPGASIGSVPQDLKYKGEKSFLVIGDNCTFREYCTISLGTGENGETRIGSNCLFMAYTHVAHDCIVGNHVIMSNVATLAGHVSVEDRVVIGGLAAVHQFTKIGRNAMLGGGALVSHDVPPYTIVAGYPAKVRGLNNVGMARAGVSEQIRREIKKAFRILYRSSLSLSEAITQMEEQLVFSDELDHFVRFLRNAERGVCPAQRTIDKD
ncbi:MAG: acyl-ACP--UDP-N-acetylglucosamine O-acyltransferase [Negativicutes bacterium]|jgi:UDP-N-acetylglucosamine acyltransferase|nr:acyl-ACP--UDP-N-acetylglucosamine O-acyltransferase [Negativicutes bacterium]